MRKVSTLVGLTLFVLAAPAWAQDEAPAAAPEGDAAAAPAAEEAAAPAPAPAAAPAAGKLTIGVDGAFQLPLGNLADGTGMGFGALVRAEYNLIPSLNGTLRTGYIYSLSKDTAGLKTSLNNIPIWVGGKYFITDMIYGAAEVGLNMLTATVSGEMFGVSVDTSSSENKFGGTVGAGALIGPLDVKAQLEVLDFGEAGDSMAVMVNVGYNFLKLL
jgi:ABC-type amino acid transport substrate-binding protein